MKKQILFLTFFIAAIFAGMNNSYAQNTEISYMDAVPASCPTPATITCATAGGALNPAPGETYLYDIAILNGSTVEWFVTTDLDVIAAATGLTTTREAVGGSIVLSAGTTGLGGNATYNDGANIGDKLEVTWNYFAPGQVVLLVAYALDATGTCTDNVEVYRIEPVFNFILDIVGVEDDGTLGTLAVNADECVSPVVSALYDDADDLLTMDYGENWIYYVVSAANWVHSWEPTFVAPTSTGGSTVGDVEWAYADEAAGAGTTWNAAGVPVLASHYLDASSNPKTAVGPGGECIVLRVHVDHDGVNELIVAEDYTVGVDGVMYDATLGTYANGALADLDESATGAAPCLNDVTDEATYTITPRPDLNAEDPTPFETKD